MAYHYQKITKEEEKGLREKYETAVDLAHRLAMESVMAYREDLEANWLPAFCLIDYYGFSEMVVQDEEKKMCLMKSGYTSKNPDYKFRLDFACVLFLFIEEQIVLVDMNDFADWIDLYEIFVPSGLAEKDDEIIKLVKEMYAAWCYGQRKTTADKLSWHYEEYRGYTCYDKEK